jgi:hypothetical protein
VSFLEEKGPPGIVQRAYVCPPHGQIGPINPEQRRSLMASSLVAGVYEEKVDRESAYERLKNRSQTGATASGQVPAATAATPNAPAPSPGSSILSGLESMVLGSVGPRGSVHEGILQSMLRSGARAIGSQLGGQIVRGVLGSMLGSASRGR